MRLIDADALEKASCPIGKLMMFGGECIYTQTEIDRATTIDAVPVVHAYWKAIGHKSARICSRCEKDEPYKFADNDADVFDYCPHCGARMDERREDG